MGQIYLGKPSEKLVEWCKEHYGPKPSRCMCFTALEPNSSVDMVHVDPTQSSITDILSKPRYISKLLDQFEMYYKLNDGEWTKFNWDNYSIDFEKTQSTGYLHTTSEIVLPNVGDKLYISNQNYVDGTTNFLRMFVSEPSEFLMTNSFLLNGSLKVSGNIMSLLVGNAVDEDEQFLTSVCPLPHSLKGIFMQASYSGLNISNGVLKDASELDLHTKVLNNSCDSSYCYANMFQCIDCVSQCQGYPKLPAYQLAPNCYQDMFYDGRDEVHTFHMPQDCYYSVEQHGQLHPRQNIIYDLV